PPRPTLRRDAPPPPPTSTLSLHDALPISIQLTTYASYAGMMRSAILPYFLERDIRLEQLTAKDIQDFYSFQLQRVSANTVIHYQDRKSTRLNSSHVSISYAVFCWKKKNSY